MNRDDLLERINEIGAMEWKSRKDQRQAKRIIKLLDEFRETHNYDTRSELL